MNPNMRMIVAVVCLLAGLAFLLLPEAQFTWLPGSKAAGGVLALSGVLFLARALRERKQAAISGQDFKVAPPAGAGKKRRRRK